MFDRKYGKVLTVLLIIAIVAIVGLLIFFGYERLQKSKNEKEALAAIEEFNQAHGINTSETPSPEESSEPETDPEAEGGAIPEIVPSTTTNPSNTNNGGNTSSSSSNKSTYKGFVMVGYIEIPRNNVKLPILEKVTKKSLETSVVILYPLNAKLNEVGNVVIAGHNYRNSLFFSKNKNLKEGDKIYITDESGRKLTYVVYSNFQATAEDTSFYTRDTNGVPEITLTTCVANDSSKRTIILARAE